MSTVHHKDEFSAYDCRHKHWIEMQTNCAAYTTHIKYEVGSYWSECPYYVSAMGNLITQSYWETHWTPIEWQKQLRHKPPCCYIKPLVTWTIFTRQEKYKKIQTTALCYVQVPDLSSPLELCSVHNNHRRRQLSLHQWNMAQIHWQSMANLHSSDCLANTMES